MRIHGLWIGSLLALLVPVPPALAATVTVSSDVFTPAGVTVLQGESVTWNNTGGFHNVHFDDDSFVMPSPANDMSWSVSRAFNTPGTVRYYCDVHGGPNGVGMAGTVTVLAPGAAPPPSGAQPVVADKVAPAVALSGAARQRVLRQRAVVVLVEVDEASTVKASGTVAIPGAGKVVRLKSASRRLAPRVRTKLKLRVSKRPLRALRRALKKRSRLTATLTVTARDAAGNTRSAKRKLKLRA